ncbi:MAG: SAM-dependent methyltransferase [Candidatus Altiarchaeota archaeon]
MSLKNSSNGGNRFRTTPDDTADFIRQFNAMFQESERTGGIGRILQGKKGAKEVIARNKITDPRLISRVLKHAIPYSQFQDLFLYGKGGFFSEKVDFRPQDLVRNQFEKMTLDDAADILHTMPLFPQMLSPWFGRVMSELILTSYTSASGDTPKDLTLLGLGAGRGYLDYDVVDYATGSDFLKRTEGKDFAEKMAKARFIVSDKTERSVEFLRQTFSPLIAQRNLGDRVLISQLDARNFNFGSLPCGVVYFNELLDNLPMEPIIQDGDRKYRVFIVPNIKNAQTQGEHEYRDELGKEIPELKDSVLTRGEFEGLVSTPAAREVSFTPVLVPLSATPDLNDDVERSSAVRENINSRDFGGIYPYQVGVRKLLTNVRDSFQHGAIVMDDYTPSQEGWQNYNNAINIFKRLVFGEYDLEFQIDFAQVREEASRIGMQCTLDESQKTLFHKSRHLIDRFGEKEFKRWNQALGAKLHPAILPGAARQMYESTLESVPDRYRVVALQF